MSKANPIERLLQMNKDVKRYAPVTDAKIDRSFSRTRLGIGESQRPAKTTLGTKPISRHLGGSGTKIKSGAPASFKTRSGSSKVTPIRARGSIGILGEDKDARTPRPGSIQTNDTNKPWNKGGFDRGGLTLNKKGKFAYEAADTKAHQARRYIGSASALTKNLVKNLRSEMEKAKAHSRNPSIPKSVRVLYRATAMTLNKILGPKDATPKQTAANIKQALKSGVLQLSMNNNGGNAPGISKGLKAAKIGFVDLRQAGEKAGTFVFQALKRVIASTKLVKVLGRKGFHIKQDTQIKQDMSRIKMLLRKGYGGSNTPADAKEPKYVRQALQKIGRNVTNATRNSGNRSTAATRVASSPNTARPQGRPAGGTKPAPSNSAKPNPAALRTSPQPQNVALKKSSGAAPKQPAARPNPATLRTSPAPGNPAPQKTPGAAPKPSPSRPNPTALRTPPPRGPSPASKLPATTSQSAPKPLASNHGPKPSGFNRL